MKKLKKLSQGLIEKIEGQVFASLFLHHGHQDSQMARQFADLVDMMGSELVLQKVSKLNISLKIVFEPTKVDD